MKKWLIILTLLTWTSSVLAELPEIKITPEWKAKITQKAPSKPTVQPQKERTVLLFSLMTGFQHWVTPHTSVVVKILGDKTGAYNVIESNDINMFSKDNLKKFDAVILNNTCSISPQRNMFLDVLGKEKEQQAKQLEQNLINFVADGNGLVAIHGAIGIINNSEAFCDVLGGAFYFHPVQQEIIATPCDPNHPLTKAFKNKPLIHVDEPYLFKGAYTKKNFHPLMVMDTDKLNSGERTKEVQADVRYIAWIKKYEKGRVFYCSPSHNAQSFEDPRLLQFVLDGIQYALSDLKCDDSPLKPEQ